MGQSMSIIHKAYLFAYNAFKEELASLLYKALGDNDLEQLHQFIQQYRYELTNLYTWEPLAEDWVEHLGDSQDVQWYADIALTKYYDLVAGEMGLGYGFDALGVYLQSLPQMNGKAALLICGSPFGPPDNRLDPGRMGTGLLNPTQVEQFHRFLEEFNWPVISKLEADLYEECLYKPESVADITDALAQLKQLYKKASEKQMGVLFTDFT
jgi:hypothetical protein